MTTLCSGPTPGIAAGAAGPVVLAEVDPRVDHAHPVGGDPLLLDHDPLDRLAQDDHRRRVPADPALDRDVEPEGRPSAQAVALDLVAQERVDLVDHRPAVPPAGEVAPASPRRSAGRGPGRTGYSRAIRRRPADPGGGRQRERRRPLEVAPRRAAPTGGRARRCASTTSTPRAFSARRILIGSIAVPSYSPGIGKDVTIKMRIAAAPCQVRGQAQDSNPGLPRKPQTGGVARPVVPAPTARDERRGPAPCGGAGRRSGRRRGGGRGPRWRRRGCRGRCRDGGAAARRGRAAGRSWG